jgi:membrane protein
VGGPAFGAGNVTTQPGRLERDPASPEEPALPPTRKSRLVASARARYEGSPAQDIVTQLKGLDVADQVMLFGTGLLLSLLPLLILLSAFASERADDDIALHLGLNSQAAGVTSRLFKTAPASLNAATVLSLVFVVAGTVTVASSLQLIYERVFHQEHRGWAYLPRRLAWVVAVCGAVALESVVARAATDASIGWSVEIIAFAVFAPFFWWSMHFLLGGRVGWLRLLPSAIATGLCFAGLGVFSRFYFSSTIISDNKIYGTFGTVFSILTWLAAIAAVIILGTVAGAVWEDRRKEASRRRARPLVEVQG